MKKERKEELNKDGTEIVIKTVETTPKDGFVHIADINNTNADNYGKYHKGYSKGISISTNDPRITRPFVYGMCLLFFGIGLITLFVSLLVFNWMSIILGLIFISFSIFAFMKAKKDMDNIEKELLKNPNYNPKDKEVITKFKKEMKNSIEDVTTSVFSKKE